MKISEFELNLVELNSAELFIGVAEEGSNVESKAYGKCGMGMGCSGGGGQCGMGMRCGGQ